MQGMRRGIIQVDESARQQRLGSIVTAEVHFASQTLHRHGPSSAVFLHVGTGTQDQAKDLDIFIAHQGGRSVAGDRGGSIVDIHQIARLGV